MLAGATGAATTMALLWRVEFGAKSWPRGRSASIESFICCCCEGLESSKDEQNLGSCSQRQVYDNTSSSHREGQQHTWSGHRGMLNETGYREHEPLSLRDTPPRRVNTPSGDQWRSAQVSCSGTDDDGSQVCCSAHTSHIAALPNTHRETREASGKQHATSGWSWDAARTLTDLFWLTALQEHN